jgi:Icc-related predicted phosphoesterase
MVDRWNNVSEKDIKVLIAHKYPAMILLFVKLLQLENIKKIEIVNSIKEIELRSKHKPKLLIIDGDLLDRSTLKKMKEKNEEMKFFLISKDKETLRKNIEGIIDEAFSMPFDIWDFLLRLRVHINK